MSWIDVFGLNVYCELNVAYLILSIFMLCDELIDAVLYTTITSVFCK